MADRQTEPYNMAAADTATSRDWTKLAPNGDLLPSAINADSSVLIDAKSGKILFQKDADDKRYPASTTKIMTCLLALEKCKDLSSVVTIGTLPKADFIDHAENIDLRKGEKLTMEQLLYIMMVYSGNDVADAVAQYIGKGSIDDFVAMMNEKAKDLGLTNTHYTSSNGLADDTDHYTTANDMAKLAAAAIKYPDFVKIVSTVKYTLPPTNKHPDSRTWYTTNYLLRNEKNSKYPGSYYAYAAGIKTGVTSMAGNSLVSLAENNGVSLISVVMHDNPRKNIFPDSITMFEYGFKFYDTVELVHLLSNETFNIDIKNAPNNSTDINKLSLSIDAATASTYLTDRVDVIADIKKNPSSMIKSEVTITKDTAPIKRNEVVGTVTFTYNNTPLLICNLLASRDVDETLESNSPSTSAASSAGNNANGNNHSGAPTNNTNTQKGGSSIHILFYVVGALAIVTIALAAIRLINVKRRGKRFLQYNNYR